MPRRPDSPDRRAPRGEAAAPARSARNLAVLLALLALGPLFAGFDRAAAQGDGDRADRWSNEERSVLASMHIGRLPATPRDPSNAVADHPRAVALGKRLFADPRLSRDGTVSCASCHAPEQQFQDGLPVGKGVGTGTRRTMPVAASAHSPWLFWDGRKDSLWAQALGPLEDGVEHGGNRMRLVRTLIVHYPQEYESVFGRLPDLGGLPADASPLGSPEHRQAWAAMTEGQRDTVNRSFANLGKAIAAYERTLSYGDSRFDRYVAALRDGDRAGLQVLTAPEVRGLRLFVGKGQCSTCHNGPLFTDQHFHNTGVPPRDPRHADRGRSAATAKVQADEFNCLGRYSDAPAAACEELRFMASNDPGLEGAFKTPSLRNVALRAPYMHAGQFSRLEEVIAHYVRSPRAAVGHSELAHAGKGHAERQPIRLTAAEASDLAAFLRSLSGPLVESARR